MTWQMYRWVWKLDSPIHLGLAPSGILNRTRLFISARTIWGALTAELSRRRAGNSFPNYESVGRELQQSVRFTYLFPAEKINRNWFAWLPTFKSPQVDGEEIKEFPYWINENTNKKSLSSREFRKRILSSRPSTAIHPGRFSAEEGTLREMEVIEKHWKSEDVENRQVAFVGYVFIRSDASIGDEIFEINELFVGADTRYGLGRIVREGEPSHENKCFGKEVELNRNNPLIKTDTILAHLNASKISFLKGSMEMVQQWDKGNILISGLAWIPGSFDKEEQEFSIMQNGFWESR